MELLLCCFWGKLVFTLRFKSESFFVVVVEIQALKVSGICGHRNFWMRVWIERRWVGDWAHGVDAPAIQIYTKRPYWLDNYF